MTRARYMAVASALLGVACAHNAPKASQRQAQPIMVIHETYPPAPAAARRLFQFNDEPPIIQVADGKGGPPLVYHGRPLNPDQIKSIVSLSAKDARARFGDQTLTGAVLIQLK